MENCSLREFDGPLSPEERRTCKTLPELQGASCAPRETTSKTKKDTEQYSQCNVLQRHRWHRQSSWTPSQKLFGLTGKQVTQFQCTLRSRWPKLPDSYGFRTKNVLNIFDHNSSTTHSSYICKSRLWHFLWTLRSQVSALCFTHRRSRILLVQCHRLAYCDGSTRKGKVVGVAVTEDIHPCTGCAPKCKYKFDELERFSCEKRPSHADFSGRNWHAANSKRRKETPVTRCSIKISNAKSQSENIKDKQEVASIRLWKIFRKLRSYHNARFSRSSDSHEGRLEEKPYVAWTSSSSSNTREKQSSWKARCSQSCSNRM